MARVRVALEADPGRPLSEPAPRAGDLARLAGAGDDLVSMFAQRAVEAAMTVHRLKAAAVVSRILSILQELDAKRVAVGVGSGGVVQQLALEEALRAAGREVVDWRAAAGLEPLYEVDAGITDVQAVLAESGTLICNSGAVHGRGLSLVPLIHLAIVRRCDILADMIDYWARLQGTANTDLPSSIVFITGPSKTADIEGALIRGVHGPGQVHILLLEDDPHPVQA